jgi:ATP synthase protein I
VSGDPLNDFDKKIADFRQDDAETGITAATQDQINQGMQSGRRAGGIFVSHVMAGGLLGYGVDRFLHTAPLFLLVLLFVGFGYGLYRCKKIAGGPVK